MKSLFFKFIISNYAFSEAGAIYDWAFKINFWKDIPLLTSLHFSKPSNFGLKITLNPCFVAQEQI